MDTTSTYPISICGILYSNWSTNKIQYKNYIPDNKEEYSQLLKLKYMTCVINKSFEYSPAMLRTHYNFVIIWWPKIAGHGHWTNIMASTEGRAGYAHILQTPLLKQLINACHHSHIP